MEPESILKIGLNDGALDLTFLGDDRIGLHAIRRDDLAEAAAWFEGEPPADLDVWLEESERIPWGRNPVVRLIAFARDSGRILGGVVVRIAAGVRAEVAITIGIEPLRTEDLLARVLTVVSTWLLDEVGLLAVSIDVDGDEAMLYEATMAAGFAESVRLRERLARGDKREDLVTMSRTGEAR